MKQIQLINVKTNEVNVFPIRKDVAEYIESLNITDNSLNTITQKVRDGLKDGEVIYETYKIVEITDQSAQLNIENLQTAIAETTEHPQHVFTYEVEEKAEETPATDKNPIKKRNGKQVKWYVNGELKQTFPSIKACATFLKEEKELKSMPFAKIMKSIRENVDWDESSFKFAE
ncbi:hypothetical protein OJ967_25855 [Peribacillus frigoritolerans]|uniref:hypothetical protein n=1 Tax=Peribacillus frigoritolerans TaxID=450367 RepID=UPI0022276800|nr:hypothetical protein [Peribacillus frigoritolerans]UYY98729.1 hypothetical protein OJ967_25855 [Peribacillus frigoritolerans]